MVQGSGPARAFDLMKASTTSADWTVWTGCGQRANAFSVDAAARGIANPKGVLLAGVQGCGKSLKAAKGDRAAAGLLCWCGMDLSALLEAQRGSSEQNLRDVLTLMETIAPSVLWLEEIDKAFAGFQEEAGSDATDGPHRRPLSHVVARAQGVCVRRRHREQRRGTASRAVATRTLDETVLRRPPGNYYRAKVDSSRIHLDYAAGSRRSLTRTSRADPPKASSGAEIEQDQNSAIIESYSAGADDDAGGPRGSAGLDGAVIEDDGGRGSRVAGVGPAASPRDDDNRVLQTAMDEEERKGETNVDDGAHARIRVRWMELAEYGQLDAAGSSMSANKEFVTFACRWWKTSRSTARPRASSAWCCGRHPKSSYGRE
ncbi:MAG: AAA family ATPase [Planctomycetaceae bacterium]